VCRIAVLAADASGARERYLNACAAAGRLGRPLGRLAQPSAPAAIPNRLTLILDEDDTMFEAFRE